MKIEPNFRPSKLRSCNTGFRIAICHRPFQRRDVAKLRRGRCEPLTGDEKLATWFGGGFMRTTIVVLLLVLVPLALVGLLFAAGFR
jgi:hypothetical protein